MNINFKIFSILSLLLAYQTNVYGSSSVFFDDKTIQNFKLEAPFSKINQFKKSSQFIAVKKQKFDGILSYTNSSKDIVKLTVKISIKGFTSIEMCEFPKLELKISNSLGTIFENIKSIDLNTHCDDPKTPSATPRMYLSMYNAHREVALYKIQDALGLTTYLTRPALLTYIDSENGLAPPAASKEMYQAFFIEDKSAFIKRNSLYEIKGSNDVFKTLDIASGKTKLDQYAFLSVDENKGLLSDVDFAMIELFQNLIGNGDWFIKSNQTDERNPGDKTEIWNSKIFRTSNGNWIPVAQDFNLSFASYAELLPDVPGLHVFPPLQKKFFDRLDSQAKNLILNKFIEKKSQVLEKLDLLKNDSKYTQIKTYLENRFEWMIQQLKN